MTCRMHDTLRKACSLTPTLTRTLLIPKLNSPSVQDKTYYLFLTRDCIRAPLFSLEKQIACNYLSYFLFLCPSKLIQLPRPTKMNVAIRLLLIAAALETNQALVTTLNRGTMPWTQERVKALLNAGNISADMLPDFQAVKPTDVAVR